MQRKLQGSASAIYSWRIDLGYFEFIGYATVVDSLSAIKKLIFEEKRLTKKELLEAVNNDFKGYEAIRQLLLHAPSYGNDDSYTDEIGQLLDLEAQKFTHKYGKELGVHMDLRLVPFTSHVPFGKVIGQRRMEDFLIHHYPMAPVHHKGQILTDQQQYYYQIIKQKL